MGIIIKDRFTPRRSCLDCLCENGPILIPMRMSGPETVLKKLKEGPLDTEAELALARLELCCRTVWDYSGDSTESYPSLRQAALALLNLEPQDETMEALQQETRQALEAAEKVAFALCLHRSTCPQAAEMLERLRWNAERRPE